MFALNRRRSNICVLHSQKKRQCNGTESLHSQSGALQHTKQREYIVNKKPLHLQRQEAVNLPGSCLIAIQHIALKKGCTVHCTLWCERPKEPSFKKHLAGEQLPSKPHPKVLHCRAKLLDMAKENTANTSSRDGIRTIEQEYAFMCC